MCAFDHHECKSKTRRNSLSVSKAAQMWLDWWLLDLLMTLKWFHSIDYWYNSLFDLNLNLRETTRNDITRGSHAWSCSLKNIFNFTKIWKNSIFTCILAKLCNQVRSLSLFRWSSWLLEQVWNIKTHNLFICSTEWESSI